MNRNRFDPIDRPPGAGELGFDSGSGTKRITGGFIRGFLKLLHSHAVFVPDAQSDACVFLSVYHFNSNGTACTGFFQDTREGDVGIAIESATDAKVRYGVGVDILPIHPLHPAAGQGLFRR